MKKLVLLSTAVLWCGLSTGAQQTRVGMPTPPQSMDPSENSAAQDDTNLKRASIWPNCRKKLTIWPERRRAFRQT